MDGDKITEGVIPIIREFEVAGLFGKRTAVLGIWPYRIMAGFVPAKPPLPALSDSETAAASVANLRWRGRHINEMPDGISKVVTSKLWSEIEFAIHGPDKTVVKFAIRASEAGNVLWAFDQVLGSRLVLGAGVADAVAASQAKRVKRINANRRLAAGKPPALQSRPLGWALKAAGAAALLAGAGFLIYTFKSASTMGGSESMDDMLVAASLLIIGNFTYRAGRQVGALGFDEMLARDPRPPIVFLRSFDSEDVETPAPGQAMSERIASRLFNRIPFAPFVLDFFLFVLHFFYALQGSLAERVEEQISRAVKAHGPMIAIGKPGERIATPGAARAYVRDDQWQDFILSAIDRAALVFIQVENTGGTMWEFHQCIERVAPTKLLIMLTANYGSPSAYEQLRKLSEGVIPMPLPLYAGKAAFICFDEEWNATALPLRFRAPFLRSLLPSVVNYRRSIGPFLSRVPHASSTAMAA